MRYYEESHTNMQRHKLRKANRVFRNSRGIYCWTATSPRKSSSKLKRVNSLYSYICILNFPIHHKIFLNDEGRNRKWHLKHFQHWSQSLLLRPKNKCTPGTLHLTWHSLPKHSHHSQTKPQNAAMQISWTNFLITQQRIKVTISTS